MSSSEDNTIKGGGPGENLSFAERLGAEPRETAAAERATWQDGAQADPDQQAAVEAAEALEGRIENTLRAPAVPAGLVDEILALPGQAETRQGPPSWLALAASVVLLVGVSGAVWMGMQPGDSSVASYVQAHFEHDGDALLLRAGESGEGSDAAQVAAVMASLGASTSPEFTGRIQFIKFCPTPDSQGAHMVVSTSEGPVTVIFMPAVTLEEPLFLSFDGVDAKVVGLESGAAAIIGAGEDTARELRASLESGIRPMNVDT